MSDPLRVFAKDWAPCGPPPSPGCHKTAASVFGRCSTSRPRPRFNGDQQFGAPKPSDMASFSGSSNAVRSGERSCAVNAGSIRKLATKLCSRAEGSWVGCRQYQELTPFPDPFPRPPVLSATRGPRSAAQTRPNHAGLLTRPRPRRSSGSPKRGFTTGIHTAYSANATPP